MSAILPTPKPVIYQELTFADKVQVVNRLYFLALLGMLVGVCIMAWQLVRFSNDVAQRHPFVVRVDNAGRWDAVNVQNQNFIVNERELKYFVSLFTDLYFTRDHATVAKSYPQVGYFMTPELYAQQQAADAKSQWLKKFIASSEDNQQITITNIVVQQDSPSHYGALVYFDKVYLTMAGGMETRREKYIETLRLHVNGGRVTPELIPHNPLGFFVESVKTDQAF